MESFVTVVKSCVRRYRLDRNPLRRRTDRIESAAVLAVMLVILLSVLPAVLAGRAAHDRAVYAAAHDRQVQATVLRDVPAAPVAYGDAPVSDLRAPVRWTDPSGTTRTGEARVPPLSKAGTLVPIWVNERGRPVASPPDEVEAVLRGAATGVLVLSGAVALTLGVFAGFRSAVDRVRYREWEADWRRADARWRRRRQA
ncbi:hypothetical protein [Nonomuraea pusilla]|uniref:Transmembrane protein n=1 Tax=Nonomuraea pusilla TaxID=46177 RepID=A0A1H8J3G9_9ACTN|nr:hypothetical protein [Nonomuraea pusilla]SEN74836.1 hypothetical protein SAMN05660976_08221 [Nonomuraea pusilla]